MMTAINEMTKAGQRGDRRRAGYRIAIGAVVLVFTLAASNVLALSLFYDTDPLTATVDGGTGNWNDVNWKTSKNGTSATNWADGSDVYLIPATTLLTLDLQGNTNTVNYLTNADGAIGRDVELVNGVLIVDSMYNRSSSSSNTMDLGGLDRLDLASGILISQNGLGVPMELPVTRLTGDQTWTDGNSGNGKVTRSPSLDLQGHTLEINSGGGSHVISDQWAYYEVPVSNGSIRVTGPLDVAPTTFTFPMDIDTPVNVVSGGLATSHDASCEPFGRSAPILGMNANLGFMPRGGSGTDVVYTVATNAGSTLPIDGFRRVIIDNGTQNSVDVLYGNASDSGSLLPRSGRSVMGFTSDNAATPSWNNTEKFHVAGGSNRVPMAHGLVHPYVFYYRGGGATWNTYFIGYDDTTGFKAPSYHYTLSGSNDTFSFPVDCGITNTVRISSYSVPFTVTNSASMHALWLGANMRMALGDNVTLTFGDPAVGFSGINLLNNSITQAVGTAGGKIAFGTNEAVIVFGNGSTRLLKLEGSGGLTLVSPTASGNLTLSDDNTLSGRVTVHQGTLYVGDNGTNGTLGANNEIEVNAGASVRFNRSDSVSWTGTVTGDGGIGNAGSGALDLMLNGTTTLSFINNTGGGTLNLNGDSAVTNNLTGTSFSASRDDGYIDIQSGNWVAANISSSLSAGMRGTLRVATGVYFRAETTRSLAGTVIVDGGDVELANLSAGEWSGGLDSQILIYSGRLATETGDQALGDRAGCKVVQTGGTAVYYGQNWLTLGGNSTARVPVNRAVTNSYTLSGGKLVTSLTLRGLNAAAGNGTNFNYFTFSDGTLAVKALDMTLVSGGVLTQSGGKLAPGDEGVAGRTVITGGYEINDASAAVAFDIGGTVQANDFQTGANYYDFVQITKTATLTGTISATLIDSFIPASGTVFTVLSAAGVNGAFINAPASGSAIPALQGAGTNGSFVVDYTNNQVRLTYEPSSAPAVLSFSDWQILYFGGTNILDGGASDDYDKDGLSNVDEFKAGTVPTNKASVVAISTVSLSNSHVMVTWTTSGGDPSGNFGVGKTNVIEAAIGYNGQFTNVILTTVITTLGDTVTNAVHIGGGGKAGQYYRVQIP